MNISESKPVWRYFKSIAEYPDRNILPELSLCGTVGVEHSKFHQTIFVFIPWLFHFYLYILIDKKERRYSFPLLLSQPELNMIYLIVLFFAVMPNILDQETFFNSCRIYRYFCCLVSLILYQYKIFLFIYSFYRIYQGCLKFIFRFHDCRCSIFVELCWESWFHVAEWIIFCSVFSDFDAGVQIEFVVCRTDWISDWHLIYVHFIYTVNFLRLWIIWDWRVLVSLMDCDKSQNRVIVQLVMHWVDLILLLFFLHFFQIF